MITLRRGVLITFEGIDGSGKTTLAKELSKKLQAAGLDLILTKEPGATSVGTDIRSLVQHQASKLHRLAELFLFAADRAQHVAEVVKPALQSKKLVLSDRMADSSRAYQGFGRRIDKDFLESVIDKALQGIKPDIVFYLMLDTQKAWQRILNRKEKLTRFEAQDKDFYEAVIRGFNTIFAERPEVVFLNAEQTPQELLEKAYTYTLEWLNIKNLPE